MARQITLPRKAILSCEVFDGIFICEKGVQVTDIEGKLKSGFFSEESVNVENQTLTGEIFDIDEKKQAVLFGLSGQNCGGQGFVSASKIWVARKLVRIKGIDIEQE